MQVTRRGRGWVLLGALLACGKHGPSPECDQYVACAEAIDATATRQLEGEFGPNGTCWATNASTADGCTTVCRGQLDLLRFDGGVEVAACQ